MKEKETNRLRPSKEMEAEVMDYIFSKASDHRAALRVWENNPWVAVSMYEVAMFPENIGLPLAFPKEVKVPAWVVRKLHNEEILYGLGEPLYLGFPRAHGGVEMDGWEVNRFGRVIKPQTHEQDEEGFD